MAPESEDTLDPLERLTDEFLERHRSGEAIDPDTFADEHPEHAERIRELIPLLLQLESTRAPEPAQAEERIGRWRVLRELGRGGMGVVYLVADDETNERAALKLMSANNPDAVIRFQREADAVSRVNHPGICRVLEVSAVDGRLWIAFEHIEGESLADALRRERRDAEGASEVLPRDPKPWLDIGRQVAQALHAAHEVGLVHRDVKPGNIMLAPDGRAVVLDFGLAYGDAEQTRITQTGVPIGTPAYMSPEQVRAGSAPLDRRTDVYSLGATLYESLTLEAPFSGPTIASLFSQILTAMPEPARRHAPELSRDIEVVLATALEKRPERRYATADAFATDLARAHKGVRVRARPASPLRRVAGWAARNPGPAAVVGSAALALITGLVVALVLLSRVNQARDNERAAAQSERVAAQSERAAARHMQARALVASSVEAEREDAMLSLLLAREALRVERSPVTVSRLHAAVEGSLERARLSGHGGGVTTVAWSADGQRVATGARDGKGRLFDANGTLLTTVAANDPMAEVSVRVHLSPSGTRMATQIRDGTTILWSEAGERVKTLGEAGGGAIFALFQSDDSAAVFRKDGTVSIHETDGSRRVSWVVESAGNAKSGPIRFARVTSSPPLLHVLTRDMIAISYDLNGTEVQRRMQAKDATVAELLPGGWLAYLEKLDPSPGVGHGHDHIIRAVAVDGTPAGFIAGSSLEEAILFGADTWWGAWSTADGATVVAFENSGFRRSTLKMEREVPPALAATPANGSRLFTSRKVLNVGGGANTTALPMRLWTPRGAPLGALTVGTNYLDDAVFSPDGNRIAVTRHTGDVATVHATAPVELATVVSRWRGKRRRYNVPMTEDGQHFVVFDDETHGRVMRSDGSTRARFEMPPHRYEDMLPNKGLVLLTEQGGGVRVVDLDGVLRVQLPSSLKARGAFWVGRDGALVVLTSEGVRFHDANGALTKEVPGRLMHSVPQRSHEMEVAVARPDRVVVYGANGNVVRTLSVNDGERAVWYCGSAGGRSIVVYRTGMIRSHCRCFDESGTELWREPIRGIGFMGALMSRDGRRVVTRVSNGVSLRDAKTGRQIAFLSVPGGWAYAQIDHQSQRIVVSSMTGQVSAWDLEGELLFDLPNQGAVCVPQCSRDGRRIAVMNNTMVRLYTTDTDELEKLAKQRSTRGFTEAERETFADILMPHEPAN